MFAKDIFNGVPMMVLCVLAMIVVVIQPILFLRMSWKRGKELGIQTTNMKSCVRSSMLFSIVPTLPVLINYLVLLPAFGKYFAWLRLSVMGNAAYETAMADLAATSLGFADIYDETIDINAFTTMMFVVTIAILGGAIFTMCFTKFYEKKVRQATTSIGGGKMIGLITTAMFVGMYSTLAASHVTNANKPLGIVAFIVSAGVTVLCTFIAKKHKGLKQFIFTLSIVVGMLSASLISLL
jgi:hypothetical protein